MGAGLSRRRGGCRDHFRFPVDGAGGSRSGSYEAISTLGNGLNVPGILSVVPKSFTQFANCHAKAAVKVDKGVSLPDVILDLLPGNYMARIFQKNDQQTERLLLYLDPPSVLQEFTGCRIYFEGSELVSRADRRFHGVFLQSPSAMIAPVYATLLVLLLSRSCQLTKGSR